MNASQILSRIDVSGATNVGGSPSYANFLIKLDSNGLIPAGTLPQFNITSVHIVANTAARLALNAHVGDVAKETDNGDTYMLASLPATTDANWIVIADISADPSTLDLSNYRNDIGSYNTTAALGWFVEVEATSAGFSQIYGYNLTGAPQFPNGLNIGTYSNIGSDGSAFFSSDGVSVVSWDGNGNLSAEILTAETLTGDGSNLTFINSTANLQNVMLPIIDGEIQYAFGQGITNIGGNSNNYWNSSGAFQTNDGGTVATNGYGGWQCAGPSTMWGQYSPPTSQPATPTTLAQVIAILQGYGFCA